MLNSTACLFLSFALLMSGCGGSSGGAPSLRGGVTQLYDGVATDETCELLSKTGSDDSCNRDNVGVTDVARDGKRVAVLIQHFKTAITLFMSEDSGATFTQHELQSSFHSGVEGTNSNTPGGYALHIVGPKVYLLMAGNHVSPKGDDFPNWQIAEVNLVANTYAILGKVNGAGPLSLLPSRVTVLDFLPFADQGALDLSSFNLSTKELLEPGVTCGAATGITCYNTTFYPYPLGSFAAYFPRTSAMFGDQQCRLTVAADPADLKSLTPKADCASSALFAPQAFKDDNVLMTSLGPMVGYQAGNGEAMVVGIQTGGGLIGPFDLGPGAPGRDSLQSNHHRFGGAIPVGASAGLSDKTRLVTLANGGPLSVPIPPTPCSDDSCGGAVGYLAWALDMGNDDYLAFYVLNTAPGGRHDHLYVHLEHAPATPLVIGVPDGGAPSRFVAYPEAVEAATPLEKMCARFDSCTGGTALYSVPACVSYWIIMRGGTTAQDLAYQRFLATGPACSAFGESWPNEYWRATGGCHPGCVGDALVYACNFGGDASLQEALDCAAGGTHCASTMGATCTDHVTTSASCNQCVGGKAVRCSGNVPFVEDCAAKGMICAPSINIGNAPMCATSVCTTNATARCDGPIASNCLKVGYPVSQQDCGRIPGMACDPDIGICVVADKKAQACTLPGVVCDDGALLYCGAGGGLHYVDCKSIGFASCKLVAPGRGACTM